jgi:tetratricopeptide (TPR) repeat protein
MIVVVVVIGIVGAGAAVLKGPSWLVAIAVIAAAAVAPWGKLLESRLKRDDDRRHTFQAGALHRRAHDYTDPTALGVHRPFPPYVRRDQDEEIVTFLKQGGFILVLGDSAAGKTRSAFEALKSTYPKHRLIIPERTALAAAVDEMCTLRDAVLWLDDLEKYLGPHGLTTTMITRLHGRGRSILATLRKQELKRLEDEADDRLLEDDPRKVLACANTVRLDREFTASELARALVLAHDPLIAEALVHVDKYGLAEYLAAGPQLLERWQNAWSPRTNPRGAALVQAAIDCRRAGYLSPLPKDLLNEIHELYVDIRGPRLYPESIDEAWAWVTKPWRGTTALLEESGNDAVTVFDYVVDHVQRTTSADDLVPDAVVRAAVKRATIDLNRIGFLTYVEGRFSIAQEAYARAIEYWSHSLGPKHPAVLRFRYHLAASLANQGKAEALTEQRATLEECERVFGRDHETTLHCRNSLALILTHQGKLDEAVAELQAVIERCERAQGPDHIDTIIAHVSLGFVLSLQGNAGEAAAHFRSTEQLRERATIPEDPDTPTNRNRPVDLDGN